MMIKLYCKSMGVHKTPLKLQRKTLPYLFTSKNHKKLSISDTTNALEIQYD
jgi:hypothetical protein